MRPPDRRTARRGAVTVETAIVLPVFLFLVLGVIDLGLGVFRQNVLSQAARQGARQAIVHGELAPKGWNGGPWGPAAIDAPANGVGIPAVDAVNPVLVSCPPGVTRVRVEWLDGTNGVGDRVRVTVTSEYRPIVTYIFGAPTIPLSASSTMPIAH